MSEEFTASSGRSPGSLSAGLFLCWGLNIAEIAIGFLLLNQGSLTGTLALVGGIGGVEWLYVVPLYILFNNQEKTNTAKGLIIAAGITALLNGLCWSPILFDRFRF
jgi:hypothetical protein